MPLIEAVTIEVGAAIAKSIFKLWIKDSTLGDDISSSIVDLIKSKTSDMLAQRRGNRQFENIGERIGENLLPLFQSESISLDEGSRTAVALAVAEAFNTSKLSSKLLAQQNLEPTELAKYVLSSSHSSATQLFSSTETAFYQRIVEESCKYITDIASQMPSFTEQTFAELLKREDEIIAITRKILTEFHRMREQLDPAVEAERFEIDYRDAIKRKLDVLQLLGLDVSPSNRRHRLSVAYITLSVTRKISLSPQDENTILGMTDPFSIPPQRGSEKERVSVDKALTFSHRLLIRGLAGSGKTTLLQWIAVKSATKSFDGSLSEWNNTIPFFIRLRHCIRSGLPKPEVFTDLIAPTISGRMPRGWVHMQLASGRAIILIDGVDEVSTQQRDEVRMWLNDLVATYPKARFIITSRPSAVEEGWMGREGFSDAELQSMELSDIFIFVERWHAALREELYEDEEQRELVSFEEHLKKEVRQSRPIRNLATNPLLCAMLCVLNRDRRKQLPEDRIEMYESCCYLMLERRDKARDVDLTDYPALNYRQKCLLLEDLAYWMIRNDWSEVEQQEVEARFARRIENMPGIPPTASGFDVRRLLVERACIIREPIAGQIDFTHRTFQEFLAAKAAKEEKDIGLLVAHAHNDQWREVIILACGLANKSICEELLKRLIIRGDKEVNHQYQLHLLAVACLEASVELRKEVKHEVEKRLSHLVPPKNTIDAQALAAAGELVVKHLTKSETYSEEITIACIHALARIGSDGALETLEGYTDDTRLAVILELLRAWDSFDREIYARQILSKTLASKVDLRLKGLPSLQGIQYFPNLTMLCLSERSDVYDLYPLTNLSQLQYLDLSYSQVRSLSPLIGLPQLKRLKLLECQQLHDYTSLTALPNLESVTVSETFTDDHLIPPSIQEKIYVLDRLMLPGQGIEVYWNGLGSMTSVTSTSTRMSDLL